MTPAPCGNCRLSPCGRRAECPKYRKWERQHREEAAQRAEDLRKAQPFIERSIKIKDKMKRKKTGVF